MGAGSATLRVARLVGVSLGVGGLILLGLSVPHIVQSWTAFAPWWQIGSYVALLVSCLALLVGGLRDSAVVLRGAFGALAVSLLAGVLLAPVASVGPTPDGTVPWTLDIAVIGAAAAACGWAIRLAIGYLVVLVIALAAVAVALASPDARVAALLHVLQSAFFVTLIAAVAIATRRAGRLLDLAVTSAIREVRAAAAAEAQRVERRRVAGLLHDSVIVALVAFGRGGPASDDRAADEARRALQAVEDFERPVPPAAASTAEELAWRLQALTTELDAAIRFDYGVSDGTIPAAVGTAALEASSEALRNSLRHAGPPEKVSRQVFVSFDGRHLMIAVLDDGVGFDPAAVAPTRLGISDGIIRRMRSVGGRVRVRSRPGQGTTIALEWDAL
jgi:signal transduction histidine kinase